MSTRLIAFDDTDTGMHAELSKLDGICSMRTRNERGATLDGLQGEADNAFRFLLFVQGKVAFYADNPALGDSVSAFDEDWQFVSATFGQIDAAMMTPVEYAPPGFSVWLTYDKGERFAMNRFRICESLDEAIAHAMTIFRTSWESPTALMSITIIAPGGNSPEFVNRMTRG